MEELKRFRRSVKHAFDGLGWAFSHEKNFRIELFIGFLVVLFISLFDVKVWEAVVLLLMIMWVLIFELINTVVERVVDILKPRIHPYARLIKDLMAGVVLISATVSIVVGVLIFYPYVKQFFTVFKF
ncbi:MAG: diacylglycerol kinase [uncultured bacterium]|nr:MAG: diacylglycerol kinase [uncultured bacterium]